MVPSLRAVNKDYRRECCNFKGVLSIAFKSRYISLIWSSTDMTMPNMTGEDLAQELIRIKPNIPIILCTGFSAKLDDQKASAMGIRAFVLKPIVKYAIATKVRKVLDEK